MAPVVEALERQGRTTNCSLAFSSADGGYSLEAKVRRLAHSWLAVATESHARETRAMYPHQRAVGQFALTFECRGYREFETLMTFFRSYVRTVGSQFDDRSAGRPTMQVTMAVRGFSRAAVPITGMSLGDHVGSMVFTPTVVFEAAHDPQDPTILTGAQASTFQNDGEPDVRDFFYPASAASEDTNVTPETVYDFNNDPLAGLNGSAPGAPLGSVAPGTPLGSGSVGGSLGGAVGHATGTAVPSWGLF